MKELERKRLGNVFGSQKQESEIEHIQFTITTLIKESEEKLREITRYESASKTDEAIKGNVQSTLARRLQELTSDMRREQRSYLNKVQEIHGVTEDDRIEEEVFDDLNLDET